MSVQPRGAAGTPRAHRLRHHLFTSRDFTPAYRRSASSAEIIENFAVRQDQQKPLAYGHRGFALFAVKTGGGEIFKLLLVHTRRRSRSARYRAELSRAAESRQPQSPTLLNNKTAPASILSRKYQGVVG